jgi:hypothetical protein
MPIATEPRVVRMEIGQDSARARADLVFVIDTTGSMNDKIDGLIESCQSFVDKLAAKRIDWAAAVVGFGDLTVEGGSNCCDAVQLQRGARQSAASRSTSLFRRRQ